MNVFLEPHCIKFCNLKWFIKINFLKKEKELQRYKSTLTNLINTRSFPSDFCLSVLIQNF